MSLQLIGTEVPAMWRSCLDGCGCMVYLLALYSSLFVIEILKSIPCGFLCYVVIYHASPKQAVD